MMTKRHDGSTSSGSARASLAQAALAALLAAAGIAASGCNIAAPALYLIHGPPRTPAAFELPNKPTVVFVDDRRNVLPRYELRAVAGDETAQRLISAKIVDKTFSSRELMNMVRKQDTDKDLTAIDAIGRAAGADQIIYVKIVAWALTPDGYTPRPTAGAEVRVLDCVNRVKIFPVDEESGRYVEASLKLDNTELYSSTANRRKLEDALATQLGIDVAKLFFDHETNELGSTLHQ